MEENNGVLWDEIQKGMVLDECQFILKSLELENDEESLRKVRREVLALMDFVFPTGFTYSTNQGLIDMKGVKL